MHYTPAAWVVKQFRSNYRAARAIGRAPCTVIRWRRRANGDARGLIPSDIMPAILQVAAAQNLDITAADLICGRDVPDQEPSKAR